MTTTNTFSNFSFHTALWVKGMLIGGIIGLVLIALFLSGIDNPHPDWPTYWMLRPLIVVPIAGAFGGAFFSIMKPLRQKAGWKGFAAYFFCLLVYLIGLWMGSIVGLDGTLWN